MKTGNHSPIRRRILQGALGAGIATLSATARSQPAGTVTFLVPQPAGSATDAMARKAAMVVGRSLDQTIVVENVPGAGGTLGLAKALGASGDGQLVAFGSQTDFILSPLSYKSARHRPEDFRCIAMIGSTPHMLATRPDMPAKTFAELVTRARSGKPMLYGHIGVGSLIHLMSEHFRRRMQLSLIDVPYKGVPPVVQDLIAGQIDFAFLPIGASTLTLVESGRIKAFGTTSMSATPRLQSVPQLPKVEPALHDFVFNAWSGVFVPEKTSFSASQRLHKGFIEFLMDEDAKAWMATSGVRMEDPRTLAQLDELYRNETKLYQGLAKRLGIVAQ